MQLFPRSGCVPVGGAADLQVVLHPKSADRFDVRVGVELRSGRRVGVRMTGAVEHPTIAIDKVGGTACCLSVEVIIGATLATEPYVPMYFQIYKKD